MITKLCFILRKWITLCVILFTGKFVSAQAPIANFTAVTVSGCSPLVVTFQDMSTGSPTSWYWDFGNGNTSTLKNPTASYFTTGTYTVTLTATNVSGSNTLIRSGYITVYEPPVVNFIANVTAGCFPLRVQFTDMSTAGIGNTNVNWQWDFGNGTASTSQNPLTTYTTAGTFTVTLRVTNDKGCIRTYTRTNYIAITQGVDANFTHTNSTVCTAPATIVFTNGSTGPPTLSYFWNFGDGFTSTALNPVHTYAATGSYIVSLVTSSTAGCQDTAWSNPIVIGGINNAITAPSNGCVNTPILFTNGSTPTPVSSSWAFGDGATATGLNGTHSYATTGTFTVWLYNTFPNCIDSVSKQITINPKPVADFSAPVRSSCQPPLTVNFQDQTTGGAVSWQWDFGDGGTSTQQNPSYTYNSYGLFTVKLIATNAVGCPDTIVKTSYVAIRRAIMAIPQLPVRGCIPFTITLTPAISSVDIITSYEWDFGDGGTSTVPNPTYTYVTQGTYNVRLIVTTSTGCRDTLLVTEAITVGSKPVANFSAQPIPVCGRQPVHFTDLSAPADEWFWSFGDGSTSILQNPSHSYNDTGYFDVTLIVFNNGCPDTLEILQYPHVLPPIARYNFVANCSNRMQFVFTDQSVAPQTWNWDFGDGITSTIQHPVHTFPALGSYQVRLIVTNGSCADTLIQTVRTINENPNFTANQTAACKPATIMFTATNIEDLNIVTYFWNFGNGDTLTTDLLTVSSTYANTGTYTITLITIDINGCRDSIAKPNYIRINGPDAAFSALNTRGCAGLTTTFTDNTITDGVNAITNWKWDFGDGSIQNFPSPPFQHVFNAADTFSVKLIVTDAAGCSDSITINDLVLTTDPIPGFVSADTLTCPATTVSFTNNSIPVNATSSWEFGDGGTSLVPSPTHVYTNRGLYTVKLRILDDNGCADSLIRINYITVDTPRADFTVIDTASSCVPFEIHFVNTSAYNATSLWDFGPSQGTSTLPNPVHFYSIPGVYPVKLTVTSPGGCVDSIIKTITVFDTVGARVNYVPIGGCSPLQVTLNTFTTGPMNSYFWDFGDGYTVTTSLPTINHTYASFGNFLPKVIMEDPAGCIIPLPGLDTVYVTGAKARFGIDDSLFCDFGTVNFTDSSTYNDPITRYSWTFGDGGTSLQQHPAHNYTTPGNYTVQLALQTQLGCRDTLTKPVLVKVVQSPLTNIGGDSVVCINNSLLHSGLFIQPDTSTVNWYWTFPNGNMSVLQNPLLQKYTVPGTFTVMCVAINSSGCIDTTRKTIYVNPLPVVNMPGQLTIQNGFPVTIPATYSPNTVKWVWSPADGLSCANCPRPDAGPKFNTRYQVYFTDDKGCSNFGAITVTVICKNANLFIPNTFSPNGDGSNDVFYPRGKGLERVRMLRIFNRWGEVVFEKRDFPVNDAAMGWNGTFKGQKPMADVYVYQAEIFCDNGDIIRLDGNIALIL